MPLDGNDQLYFGRISNMYFFKSIIFKYNREEKYLPIPFVRDNCAAL